MSDEPTSNTTSALADRIEGCLRDADALGLGEAGIHLDTALVALRGYGVAPPDAHLPPHDPATVSRS